jgi:hypothetical protein
MSVLTSLRILIFEKNTSFRPVTNVQIFHAVLMMKVYRNLHNVTIITTRTRLGHGWNEVATLPWEKFIEYNGFRLFRLHCLRANEREYYIDTRMQKEEKR